jgi:hypothetical protein
LKKLCKIGLSFLIYLNSSAPALFSQPANTQFSLLSSKQTGVQFLNKIEEDDSLNVLRYEYLYNGAGVGIGDFNNDGLEDIFFSGNTGPNKLFINKGELKFEDVTNAAGVSGNGYWATGVSIADLNGDGWLDIYVCHSGKYNDRRQLSNELYISNGITNGKLSFKERAAEYGLDAPGTQSTQAAFFDFDRDGDLDMFLVNHSNHTVNPFLNTRKIRSIPNMEFGNRLFRNKGVVNGHAAFEDVTLSAGIINHALNFGLSVSISDINGDGWPDIYTTSDYSEKDCLYLNNQNGTFSDQLELSLTHISKYSMGADVADYNNDGLPDLFTLDMLPEDNHRQKLLKGPDEYDQYHLLQDSGYYKQQMRNMLHLNSGTDEKGHLRFSEIGQLAGVSNTDWSWSGLLADFDNDGWKDLFVSNGYLRDYTDLDFLKYKVADAKIKAAKEGHQHFQTRELVSQMPANQLNNYIFRNTHDLRFADKTKDWGLMYPTVSNAAAYADLDNDGDLDLVICNNNQPAMIYRNNQQEQSPTGFLRIICKGGGNNTKALGARIEIMTADGERQWQELYPVRGYQSSVSQQLHFGIGSNTSVKSILVRWPDGTISTKENIPAGQLIVLEQGSGQQRTIESKQKPVVLFTDISNVSGLTFRHKENEFVDFKDEVLLPYMLSRKGPALAVADVNGDGSDDVFVGGAIGQQSILFIQGGGSAFKAGTSQPWIADSASEDVNALFFDADGDGDPDLWVVSGGNEYADQSPEYQDRLYLNDGKGNFTKENNALPVMLSSKQSVAAADFDKDGDLDIFIGGMSLPGSFPLPARSYLLRNDSRGGKVLFTDITETVAPGLLQPGMVNTVVWSDINNDQFPELLLAGDWMPVQCWLNEKGRLARQLISGNDTLGGLWSNIQAADMDGDGDMDFLLGNAGNNNQFKASVKEPMTMHVADFDNNGTLDPIICYYNHGVSYPIASRDELLDQIVPLRKKFIQYKDFADAKLGDLFPASAVQKAIVYKVQQLASGILWNNGNFQFSFSPFPVEAQISMTNGFVVNDLDNDGKNDLFLAGNFESYRVQLGQSDAGLGLLLKGLGGQQFKAMLPDVAGNYAGGDIRRLAAVQTNASGWLVILAKNNERIQLLKITGK